MSDRRWDRVAEHHDQLCLIIRRYAVEFGVEFEDLYGACMEAAHRAAGSWREGAGSSEITWLARGARSGAVDYMRERFGRGGKRARVDTQRCPWPQSDDFDTPFDVEAPEDPSVCTVELEDLFQRADLDPRDRAIASAIGAGYRASELAPILGVSQSRVSQLTQRIGRRLVGNEWAGGLREPAGQTAVAAPPQPAGSRRPGRTAGQACRTRQPASSQKRKSRA